MKILNNEKEVVSELNLGIVSAGESKQFTFYVENDSNARLINLAFTVEHKEVSVIEFSEVIEAMETKKLVLEWKPSINLKQGLKTSLKVAGSELWK